MLIAQTMGEYGGLAGVGAAAQSAADWVEISLQQDRAVWIGVAIAFALLLGALSALVF